MEDSLTITVVNDNHPPAVDAGSDRTVNERAAVTLSGSADDPDDDAMTYAWSHGFRAASDADKWRYTPAAVYGSGSHLRGIIVFTLTATDTADESAEDTVTITVRDVPMTVSSALHRSGTITITFNQDINGAPDYSRLHIRGSGPDSGGIAFSDVDAKSYSGRTITATLDSGQKEQYDALQSPQLDIDEGAVTDADGVGIKEMLGVAIRTAGSDKRSSAPPPAIDLKALASRGVDIPAHIAEMAAQRGSGPVAPVNPDGTFDFPLVMDGQNGYLLDGYVNTLVPHAWSPARPSYLYRVRPERHCALCPVPQLAGTTFQQRHAVTYSERGPR